MAAKIQSGWISANKLTPKPTGSVRNGFVVKNVPEYDKRRIRALQNKPYRTTSVYQQHLEPEARQNDFGMQVARVQGAGMYHRRSTNVAISFDEDIDIVRTACWYCGQFSDNGHSGVDRVKNEVLATI